MLPDKHGLSHGMCLYQVMMTLHFLNDVANDTESMGKLINRIPSECLLISSLPGSALRTHVESLSKPRDVNMHSQSLAWVNLISKDTHLVFYIY